MPSLASELLSSVELDHDISKIDNVNGSSKNISSTGLVETTMNFNECIDQTNCNGNLYNTAQLFKNLVIDNESKLANESTYIINKRNINDDIGFGSNNSNNSHVTDSQDVPNQPLLN